MKYEPLTREEVCSVIAGRANTRRVPVYFHFWVHPDTFEEREPQVREILAQYPQDVQLVPLAMPAMFRDEAPEDDPAYSWLPGNDPYKGKNVAIDARIALPDWAQLDQVLAAFPDPRYPGMFKHAPTEADGRFRLGQWFFCLFERHWSIRGMDNALMDYYQCPDEVHRLFRALTDFYLVAIERVAVEQKCDGFWTSDDLGTQKGEFFSVDIFREFFKPYYKELIDKAHEHDMSFWMHACGDVTRFVPEWLEIGLDVLHPIQKYAMDETAIAREYGGQMTVFSGMEVQQVIPWGTPDEVRAEVRFLMDTFWRKGEGRCMFTAGNGINGDCTLASLEALFDEAFTYGGKVATQI
ncbi:uroporphyrinogen decarboxylase family protein [Candidatus Sumerlaeota bacterium]